MEIPKTRVIFDRKNVSTKTKKASVIIEVYYQRKRKFFTTGVELYKDQWKKLGCVKFACWERPDVFFHKVHSANQPNGNKATHVNVLFSEEGYNLVQEIAGKGNMAAWIRKVIAEKLNVKPTDLFKYGKDYKGTDVPQRE